MISIVTDPKEFEAGRKMGTRAVWLSRRVGVSKDVGGMLWERLVQVCGWVGNWIVGEDCGKGEEQVGCGRVWGSC